jgi:hypothetical protein
MEMSLFAKLRSAGVRKAGKLALLCVGLAGAAIGLYYILYQIIGYVAVLMLLGSIIANNSIDRSSIKNIRGDTVEAMTEAPPGRHDPEPTVIRLKRAHHWLSTTLLKAESLGLHYHAEWLDDNTVEITLVFGCLVRLKTPVTTVGPIRIFYRLADGDRHLGSCPPGVPPYPEALPERIPEGR